MLLKKTAKFVICTWGVDDSGDVVLMVTTMRPDETVRIISFRRADEKERKIFQEHTGYVKR